MKAETISAPPRRSSESLADLKRKSVGGSMVTVLAQGISSLVQLVSTVVLARLLSPEDFGVASMVGAITAFAALFQDMGLSAAAVQKDDLTHELQSNLFWLNVAMGAILTCVLAAGAPLVASLYRRPELTWVTVVIAFNFLIRSVGTQHGVILTRRMQFGRKSIATIGGTLVSLTVSVYLGLKDTGTGHWCLGAWLVLLPRRRCCISYVLSDPVYHVADRGIFSTTLRRYTRRLK